MARDSSLARSGLIVAAGTLFARTISFLRNSVLAAAIGTGLLGDSYNVANSVPNMIFLLLGGGTIASIFVPQLVRIGSVGEAAFTRYVTVLLLGSAIFGVVVSTCLMLTLPIAIPAVGGADWSEQQRHVTYVLALWCIPQVFFYAVFAVSSQVLNSQGLYALTSWLPTLSGFTVICTGGLLLLGVFGPIDGIASSSQVIFVLGAGTVLGTGIQVTACFIQLRRVVGRLSIKGGMRGLGLRLTARVAAGTVVSAAIYQVANLAVVTLSSRSGSASTDAGWVGRGYTAVLYGQTLIYVVQAVISGSLSTVLLQRLSSHYAAGRKEKVEDEFRRSVGLVCALCVPIAVFLIADGTQIARVLFARGATSAAAGEAIGHATSVLAIGLVPFALHAIILRPFYATADALTPLLSAVSIGTLWIAGSVSSYLFLPVQYAIFGIAASFSLAYTIDFPLKLARLSRKLDLRIDRSSILGIAWVSLSSLLAGAVVLSLHVVLPGSMQLVALLRDGLVFCLLFAVLTWRSRFALRRLPALIRD